VPPSAEVTAHPVDAKGAPVAALQVPTDQEPAALGRDERVRLDHAIRLSTARRDVVESERFADPDGNTWSLQELLPR
jgi:hypothetical protein